MMTTAISRSLSEMRPERPHHLRQLGVVHPDPARPAHLAAGLDQRAIAVLLLRCHPVIGDLGIAAEGRDVGHRAISSLWVKPILVGCVQSRSERQYPVI